MAFRNDIDALAARHAALEAEVAQRTRARDEAARMLDEARAKERGEAIYADYLAGGPMLRKRRVLRIVLPLLACVSVLLGLLLWFAVDRNPDERVDRELRVMERYADQICQCRDSACTQRVTDDMTKWAMTIEQERPPLPRLSAAQMQRASELGERMGKCIRATQTTFP